MEIKNENVATYGLKTWEQTGTIALDFANNLDKLATLKGIDLENLLKDGWYQVGFRFGKSLIENSDTLNLDIVLSKKGDDGEFSFGYVSRTVNKIEFLNLVVNFNAHISNQFCFEKDEISFRKINIIEG